MEFKYLLNEKDIQKCFEFSLRVSSHTYQRTSRSADDFALHIVRVFMGKLGEIPVFQLLLKMRLIDHQYIKNIYEIWLGKTIVDKYDFKVKYKLDVKTVFMSNHKNIIVPLDQWNNQPKEFYVGVKVDFGDNNVHTLHRTICENRRELEFLEREGKEISRIIEQCGQISQTKVDQINSVVKRLQASIRESYTFAKKIHSQILGFCPRNSQKWITDPGSVICPEKSCKRVLVNDLEPIESLLGLYIRQNKVYTLLMN